MGLRMLLPAGGQVLAGASASRIDRPCPVGKRGTTGGNSDASTVVGCRGLPLQTSSQESRCFLHTRIVAPVRMLQKLAWMVKISELAAPTTGCSHHSDAMMVVTK